MRQLTKRDCVQLISIITVAFPNYLKGLGDAEKQGAVNLWMEFIGDMDAELGYLAVKEFLHTAETLYQSDNVPLMVENIAKSIRQTIKSEFGMRRFKVPEVNRYIQRERSLQRKLKPKEEKKKLSPPVRDTFFGRTLVEEGLIDEGMLLGEGNEKVLAVRKERQRRSLRETSHLRGSEPKAE